MITREESVQAFEALEKYQTKAAAARELGIDPRTLSRRIDRYYADPEATVYKECKENGIPYDEVSMAWVKGKNISLLWKNNKQMSYEDIRDSFIEEMKNHAPVYSNDMFNKNIFKDENNLLIIDAADVHIGKLAKSYETGGDEYNTEKAVERLQLGIERLVSRASSAFGFEKIVFVIGNDIIHIDKPNRTTTSGTPQDTDGQWWEMFLAAKKAYIKAIEVMMTFSEVHVVFCPSNHDYMSGWMLADTISSWFNNVERVSFGEDNKSVSINHRKYIVYGNNLIGFTHGDGAKEKDLANLMQMEARQHWGKTKFAYLYTHHTHHKHRKVNKQLIEKDHIGFTILSPSYVQDPENSVYIETVRSPSPADGWHSRNGYMNFPAIEAFIHNDKNGQIARLTEFFVE
jgi:hypothetical protein